MPDVDVDLILLVDQEDIGPAGTRRAFPATQAWLVVRGGMWRFATPEDDE